MTKRGILRWGGRILGGALVLVLLGAASAYGVSERRGHAKFDVPEHALTVVSDSATIARGEHLATIRGCNECHAPDMGGKVMLDDPAIGRLVSTNLTNGRRGGALTERDWERAVRHGVRRDSTPLAIMPSHEFTGFADEDLAAIIAWTRNLPPLNLELPSTRVGPVARALHTAGELELYPAEIVNHTATHPARIEATPDARYGAYMAAGCTGCHGATFSGGKIPGAPPEWAPAANLTPAGMHDYTEASFIATLRSGKRPDGSALRPPMDAKMTGRMTTVELRALWAYLQTLPPKEYGGR